MPDKPEAPLNARYDVDAPPPGQDRSDGDNGNPPDRQDTQPDVRAPRQEPTFIGPYRVLQRIGEGGMGIVYRCEQREPVRRTVAVKVIKVGMDTREVIARFNAERQALSLMNHPNVARALDAGVSEPGRPYFAMEYVAGVALTKYCDDNRLKTADRLALFIPVCQAVQHAHQKGIIHRDLKPSNILVTLIDGQPVPKIIDFGIAKAANLALTQQTLFTQIGAMIGTPEYMSPEQAQTSGMDVDTRTDIYSLGVILYELLTGALPFDPSEFRQLGLDGIARVIRESQPRRPSTRLARLSAGPQAGNGNGSAAAAPAAGASTPVPADPRQTSAAERRGTDARSLVRELRGDLDWIVMKAMEKDRARRYDTANGLAMDLRRYLAHEPVTARPPTTWYRLSRLARRRRGTVAAVAAIALSLILGITATSIATVRAWAAERQTNEKNADLKRALEAAERARATAKQETVKATTVGGFLQDVLAPPERAGDELVRDAKVVDLLARAQQEVGERFKDQPDVQLQTRYTLFRTYNNLGLANPARNQLDLAWELIKSHPELGETETGLRASADYAYYFKGGPTEREQLAARAATVARDRLGENSEPAILASTVRARAIAKQKGRADEAAALYEELVGRLRAANAAGAGTFEDANVAAPFSSVGGRLRERAQYADAERMFREGLTYVDRAHYNRLRMRWIFSEDLARTLESQGKLPDAAEVRRDIVADVRKKLGEDHPAIGPSLELYVSVLRRLNRQEDIEAIGQDLRRIFQDASDQPATSLLALARRAHSRVCAGRFREAAADYARLAAAEPTQHMHVYYQSCLLAYLADGDAFDRVRSAMLKDFGPTEDHVASMRLAKAAMLLPATPAQQAIANDMLERTSDSQNDPWFRLAKALVEFRGGRAGETIRLCRGLENDVFNNAAADASVHFLMALAYHAQNNPEQASAAARAGSDIVADRLPTLESGRIYGVGIEDWLICQVLMREAETAIGK